MDIQEKKRSSITCTDLTCVDTITNHVSGHYVMRDHSRGERSLQKSGAHNSSRPHSGRQAKKSLNKKYIKV